MVNIKVIGTKVERSGCIQMILHYTTSLTTTNLHCVGLMTFNQTR